MQQYCINIVTPLTFLVASIGLSDAVEYLLSPTVHQLHNCPDIMRMDWEDYTIWHAFLSGVKCAWFLLLPVGILLRPSHHYTEFFYLGLFNIVLPLGVWVRFFVGLTHSFFLKKKQAVGLDKRDPYFCHLALYVADGLGVAAIVLFGWIKTN